MQSHKNFWVVVGATLMVLVCCLCAFVTLGGASLFRVYTTARIYPTIITVQVQPAILSTLTPSSQVVLPTVTPLNPDRVDPEINQLPSPTLPNPTVTLQNAGTTETLDTLMNTYVPASDLLDLAARLEGKSDIPQTVTPPLVPFVVGDTKNFWVTNLDTDENSMIEAQLVSITDNAYFWIEIGVLYDADDLASLVQAFEQEIYPTTRNFFGSEWSPGVDGDPRVYILFARNLGSNLAGYYSSTDEYHPLAREFTNAVEIFILNADNLSLDETFTYGVLAHEFQHMIHWNQDRNEDAWLNEGFSELAAFINGYYESGFDWAYIQDPDLQLNDWPNDPSQTTPHYGSGFLFLNYFMGRFGEEATQLIVQNQENGLTSVDLTLNSIEATEPQTGRLVNADDVFLDWVITNYLQDGSVGDGRFAYTEYREAPIAVETENINHCPFRREERSVSQYGVDYISFTCRGEHTLVFQGVPEVGILNEGAYSGKYAFWSNKGDEADMTLTRAFDLSAHAGPLTLSYWMWYDLETNYDYVYLLASTDGKTWDILATPSGTAIDPTGNNFGWAYNGLSGGSGEAVWVNERVDISQYAGKEVYLRFEYVTDAAINGEGFLVDDIYIPEIDYFNNFEQDDGGWLASGWARIQNKLPQNYRLALILNGNQTLVEYLEVPASGLLEIPIKIDGPIDEVILVVTGTTRFTRQKANYQFEVLP